MIYQAVYSIVIGGVIALVAFIPILVWQYRRYGDFQPARMVWLTAGFIYLTALIAYTLFPLPDMSGDYCATHPRMVVLDPTRYFREMAQRLAGLPLAQALRSWEVLQMVFNVALFVPLGVLLSDFFVVRFWRGILLGFGASLLVESTQFTGNWGIMACAYRLADVNDLITNTTGTAVGYLIALLMPRFVARPAYLRKRRNMARPITRARRWTAMLLDLVIWVTGWSLLYTGGLIGAAVLAVVQDEVTASQQDLVIWSLPGTGLLAGLVLVVAPGLTRHGASLGQRIVFLRPVAAHRWQLVARMFVVQGLGVCSVFMSLTMALVVFAWVVVAAVSVIWTRRGLSAVLTGCGFVDSREPAPVGPQPSMTRSCG